MLFADALLRLRPFLSGRDHLCLFHPAAEGEMDRLGLCGCLLLLGFVTRPEFLPDGADRGLRQLSHFLRTGVIRAARNRAGGSDAGASVSKRSAQSEDEPLHRCATCGATELSESQSRVSRGARWRGILHCASPERDEGATASDDLESRLQTESRWLDPRSACAGGHSAR